MKLEVTIAALFLTVVTASSLWERLTCNITDVCMGTGDYNAAECYVHFQNGKL